MVNINDFKIYCENIIANKSQSGNTITPSQFNIAAHQAQMNVFEQDRLIFLKSGESTDFLNSFLTNKTLAVNVLTGIADYPSDFQHTAAMRFYFNQKVRPVELITNQMFGEVAGSVIMKPSKMFPKYSEFDGKFRFLPANLGAVMLDYFREPLKPVWGYSIVNNVPTYNLNTSVNFEFGQFAMKRVADAYINIIAQNIKDPQLMQYIQQERATNTSIT